MATNNGGESPDFSQPWKFSDVVLVVEEQNFHVHRAILAFWSPVFEKMFTSEFEEKGKNEIPLPHKKNERVQRVPPAYLSFWKRESNNDRKLLLPAKACSRVSNGSHCGEMRRFHGQ